MKQYGEILVQFIQYTEYNRKEIEEFCGEQLIVEPELGIQVSPDQFQQLYTTCWVIKSVHDGKCFVWSNSRFKKYILPNLKEVSKEI